VAPGGGDRRLLAYGPHPSQVAELFLPDGSAPPPVAVLMHGGFWRRRYDRRLMDDLCHDLATRGWATWNLEYRRLGGEGGWPATFEDVGAGIDALAAVDGLDLLRVVALGHSAGGHLALWAAARRDGAVRLTHAVSQAGVADLAAASRLGLSGGAADELVGGRRELFAKASPAELLPLGVPQLLVHGEADDVVPVAIARDYAAAARAAGDDVDLVTLPGVGHFEHLDPASEAWQAVIAWLP
jgi:acetyl esterase/lipase